MSIHGKCTAAICVAIAAALAQLECGSRHAYAAESPATSPLIASGDVVLKKGDAVSGVQVSIVGTGQQIEFMGCTMRSSWSTLLTTTQTDAKGHFEIRRSAIPAEFLTTDHLEDESPPELTVLIQAPGWAPLWRKVQKNSALGRVALSKSATIEGQLLTEQGTPLKGVTVRAAGFDPQEEVQMESAGKLDLVGLSVAPSARSDAQGRFVIPMMPQKTTVTLLVGGNPFAACRLFIDTAEERVAGESQKGQQPAEESGYYPRAFSAHIPDPVEILGHLTFSDTGRPCPRCSVLVSPLNGRSRRIETIRTESDEAGHFRIAEVYGESFDLGVMPQNRSKYVGIHRSTLKLDRPVIDLNLKLALGQTILGVVTDEVSKQGVPNVSVSADWPDSASNDHEDQDWFVLPVKTDRQGKFAITVPPVSGRVRIDDAPQPYKVPYWSGAYLQEWNTPNRYLRRHRPNEKNLVEPLRFEIGRGVRLQGRVTTPDGKPIGMAQVFDEEHTRGGSAIPSTDEAGRFTLRVADSPYVRVYVAHPERRLNYDSFIPLPGIGGEREAACEITLQQPAAIKLKVLLDGKPATWWGTGLRCTIPLNGKSVEHSPFQYGPSPGEIASGSPLVDFIRDSKTGPPIASELLLPGLPVLTKGGVYYVLISTGSNTDPGRWLKVHDLKPGEIRDLGSVEIVERKSANK